MSSISSSEASRPAAPVTGDDDLIAAVLALPSWAQESPAETYITNVIAGRQVACKWVRLACERHRRDLLHGEERGLWFDPEAGQHIIDFARFCRHVKGRWADDVVVLEPWQQALLWILFGWMRADGARRFRSSYWEMARKNGKSLLAAIIGLYGLVADGEGGAEIYAAATKREQAKQVFTPAWLMAKKSPALRKRLTCYRDNIHIRNTAAKFEPMGRDHDTADGSNPHMALVDELHAHRDDGMWGVLETGMRSRRQPLMFGITTAGFNQASWCYELRRYATQVLDGIVKDDSFFCIIYTLDREDVELGDRDGGWWDESLWVKSNPNLGVSIGLEDLQAAAVRAKAMPSAKGHFLTKSLSIWTNAGTQWIAAERWAMCAGEVDEKALAGRPCYGGLDLSSTFDLTALAWVFPPYGDDPLYRVVMRFWAPEAAIAERMRQQRASYATWQVQGFIEMIPGEVIDYEYVYRRIDEDAALFDVKEIAFDRWGASQVYVRLTAAGLTMVQFGQGFASMSAPMKELEKLIMAKGLAHGGHPVLAWNMHNLIATKDAAENIKPDKKLSVEKIDGGVALIMGLARATLHDAEAAKSVYDERGVREL
jgi:phage terminase large subunit-like protein